jgi:hypothetical protein
MAMYLGLEVLMVDASCLRERISQKFFRHTVNNIVQFRVNVLILLTFFEASSALYVRPGTNLSKNMQIIDV